MTSPITSIVKSDSIKKTSQKPEKENFRTISFINVDKKLYI